MQIIFQKRDPVNNLQLDEYKKFKELRVIPEVDTIPDDFQGLVLRLDATGLSLIRLPGTTGPTRLDFQDARLQYRIETSRRQEGLLKAVGLDKPLQGTLRVLDTTAGLATDAFLLAAFGCEVTMLEKSPILAALVQNGLFRGKAEGDLKTRERLDRMHLLQIDAHTYLQNLLEKDGSADIAQRPDVVYLDPMFPVRQKSAKVKKDMALLQDLLEPNNDVDELLARARQVATGRVVLKRPGKSEKKPSPKPDFQVPGKSCHFQVFLSR